MRVLACLLLLTLPLKLQQLQMKGSLKAGLSIEANWSDLIDSLRALRLPAEAIGKMEMWKQV